MSTTLTQEQRAVLVAVCDTLLPEIARQEDPGGLFATGARAAHTAERVEQLISCVEDPRDAARFQMLLSALGSPLVNLMLNGRFASITGMAIADHVARGINESW